MSSPKKSRTDGNPNLFCKVCKHLEEDNQEIVILTDPRLTTLYSSSVDNCLKEDTPQHRITDFAIHDSDLRLCWFDSKPIEEGYELFLCGNVEPIVSNCGLESDYSNQEKRPKEGPIKAQMIGPLQEWWFAGFDGGTNLIIGVESEFASYILCEPNENYSNLLSKSTKNMFITKLIIEALLTNSDLTYEDLILTLQQKDHHFDEESILFFAPFIVEQIKSFDSAAEEDENLLSETPAFRTLVELSGVSVHSKTSMKLNSKHRSHVRPIARIDARRAANSDTLTCATPLVTQFFDSVFKDVIECEDNDKQNKCFKRTSLQNMLSFESNDLNKKINWIGKHVYEDKFARTSYYSSLRINELTYTSGEFVVFRENDNSLSFGRIMFMFSPSDRQKLCHIHYFCDGNDTILGETAPNRLVFMTTNCDNIEVEKIENKIDVFITNKLETDSVKDNSERYFCTKLYIGKCGRFEDLPQEAFDSDLKCINCLIKERNEKQKIPELLDEIVNGSDNSNHSHLTDHSNESNSKSFKKLVFRGQTYSVGDCALFSSDAFDINHFNYENSPQINDKIAKEYDQTLYPERYRKEFTDYIKGLNNDLPKTLNIAKILQIFQQNSDSLEETKLLVNIFYRPHNIAINYNEFLSCDLNLLFYSNQEAVVGVQTLRGKSKVIYSKKSPEINVFIETKLFYFNQCYDFQTKTLLEPNEELIKTFDSKIEDSVHVCRHKLNVLDLFAGCGGLSYGFDKLGLVSELWAIEKDCSTLKSFETNFKSAHLFQEDVNHVLDQLIKGVSTDKNGKTFPKRGHIDLILGGPPCQGFSGMNRFSCRQYSLFKNSLVVSFLSFVDYYRPKYFVFENVRNFALFKSSTVLKIMLSCVISMGYQCHFAILQSGSYGLPQTRRRTVIIGASAGNPLPSFPEPTHVFSRRQCQLSVNIDNKRYSALSRRVCPQFRTITVDDAISDLTELSEDYASKEVRRYRLNHDITHYQKIMRTNSDNKLHDHYCKELSHLCRLRIKNIPKSSDSDWRDLPNISHKINDKTLIQELKYNFDDLKSGRSNTNQLRGVCPCAQGLECNANEYRQENTLIPWCLVHTANRQYHWSGLYGRLAGNGYFPTTVTNPEPISKQGRVLHPTQDRIISVRESARSQGFPDNFIFCGTTAEKYRQIGNAVPIPLSYALSRQFLSVFETNL